MKKALKRWYQILKYREITPDENLYRAVKDKPHLWKSELNKPSSAVFKDSKGVSVDRDGMRTEEVVVSALVEQFSIECVKAVVSIDVEFCNNLPTLVKPKPIDTNEFHAEIHESIEQVQITSSKAKKLADRARIAFLNASIE